MKKLMALFLSAIMIVIPMTEVAQAFSISENDQVSESDEMGYEDTFEWADEELKFAIEREFSEDFGGEAQSVLNPEGTYGDGTRYLFYGDSCMHGYVNIKDGRYIQSYPEYFQQYSNCYIKNMSICGATAAEDYGYNFYNEIKNTVDLQSYDVAFFQFGINDFCLSYPLGTLDTNDINTVYGGLDYGIRTLKENGVEPICILPFFYKGQANHKLNGRNLTFDDYIDAIKKICEKHDVTIVDFNTAFGMTAENYSAYYIDHVHPDSELQKRAGEYLYRFIQGYGDGEEQIEAFVARLYDCCLDRQADQAGMDYWKRMLSHNLKTGAEVAYGFVFSEEVINKNLSDDEFVELLYEALMGRASDTVGKADWLKKMESGLGREGVLKGFIGSAEFAGLCSSYGIKKGTIRVIEPRNENPGVTAFISRLYTKALGRTYETEGLNDWCGRILLKTWTLDEIATKGFFHSQEFYNRNLSDDEYVKVLYQTFFDREYDQAGYDYWMSKLAGGMKRDEVLKGFASSLEFANLKKAYGV